MVAVSGRSKCKACCEFISQGEERIGIPGRAAGVSTTYWCHPSCFAKHCVRVDLAPTGRAKCKADGSTIAKGEVRLLLGYKVNSTIYRPENAAATIVPSLLRLASRDLVIHGLDDIPLELQHTARDAILSCATDQQRTKQGSAKAKRSHDATEASSSKKARKKN
ncbi:MAG: hypothetical protein SGPRY_014820 [Prymnesium sp.]